MSSGFEIARLERGHLAMARRLLLAACHHDAAAEVAEELLFLPGLDHQSRPMAAFLDQEIIGLTVISGPWLRCLAVAPPHRGRGVGSALLDAAEHAIEWPANASPRIVRIMDQPGNYLAPGVDMRNREAIEWLARRGYRQRRINHNLIIDLRSNPAVSEERATEAAAAVGAHGYQTRRAHERDRASLQALIAHVFSRGWAFEVGRALAYQPAAVHLALASDGSVAAFAAHDGNNQGLGWFGPAGTLEEHRGAGLGKALLLSCLVDIQRTGRPVCEIAWIGPREFYERSVGVAGERCFAAMEKEITP